MSEMPTELPRFFSTSDRITEITKEALVQKGIENLVYCCGTMAAERFDVPEGGMRFTRIDKTEHMIKGGELVLFIHFMPTLLPSSVHVPERRLLALLCDFPPLIHALKNRFHANPLIAGVTYPEVAVFVHKHLEMELSCIYTQHTLKDVIRKRRTNKPFQLVYRDLDSLVDILQTNEKTIEKMKQRLERRQGPLWQEELLNEMVM